MKKREVLFNANHWWKNLTSEERVCLVKNYKIDTQLRIKRRMKINYAVGLDELFDAYWPDYQINEDLPLSKIEEIRNLRYMTLAKTNLNSMAFIWPCLRLEYLYINDTWIQNIQVISHFSKLKKLNCSTTPIQQFSPLKGLAQISELNLSFTEFKDVSIIKGLAQLKYLDLYKSALEDTRGMDSLSNLEFLSIDGSPVQNLWGLKGLTKLKTLYCGSTQIVDLYPVGTLTNLKRLDVSHTKIKSLESVYGHPKLQFIKCNDTLLNEQDIYNCRKFIETISDQEIDFPYPNSDAIAHINKVIQREIEKVRKDIKENDKD